MADIMPAAPEPKSGVDVLTRICAETRVEVARRKAEINIDRLRQAISQTDPPRGFGQVVKHAIVEGRFALIAEIKKASPSSGLIRPDFDAAALSRAYQAGGATCLSVLTNAPYFQGGVEHLLAARKAVSLPILRKEFILEPWQVYESRAIGADCILLIMAALSNDEARELEDVARSLDLDVLVEVHDQHELERALGLQTQLIGINNRNLRTLQIDLSTTETLAPLVPPDRFLISESGIRDNADLQRLAAAGCFCFLVGESLMREPDVTLAVQRLLGDGPTRAAAS
jgi:indole-3-glycerol phosphate synthase